MWEIMKSTLQIWHGNKQHDFYIYIQNQVTGGYK